MGHATGSWRRLAAAMSCAIGLAAAPASAAPPDAIGQVPSDILHTFSFDEGKEPTGALLVGADGALYGTMRSGGYDISGDELGYGTVFRVALDGAFTLLHTFHGAPQDGGNPIGGLVQTPDGRFWGVLDEGANLGPYGGGLFTIDAEGHYQFVHGFDTRTEGSGPNGGLMRAADGMLYGTTTVGPGSPWGGLYRLDPATLQVTFIHTFSGDGGARFPVGALVQASDGNLYGVSQAGGGPKNLGTIFRTSLFN